MDRHWAFTIVAILVGGIVATAGLVRPIVNPPHDVWVVAIGIVAVIVGIATGLHELVVKWEPTLARSITKTIAMLALLLIVIDVVAAVRWTRDYWMNEPPPQPSPAPHFEPPRFAPDTSHLVLNVGGNLDSYDTHDCWGSIIHRFPLFVGQLGDRVMGYCQDGAFGVNVLLLTNGNREPLAYLQYGSFFVVADSRWDWNWDHDAFEIVDENEIPRLQVIYKTSAYIEVYGVFGPDPIGPEVIADRKGERTLDPAAPYWPSDLSRIFRYPSDKFPHVRE
jgi:hypothetical protein